MVRRSGRIADPLRRDIDFGAGFDDRGRFDAQHQLDPLVQGADKHLCRASVCSSLPFLLPPSRAKADPHPPRRRLKTVADADLIIVLREGVVAEQGTHSSLLQREGGVYKGMWEQQNAALE